MQYKYILSLCWVLTNSMTIAFYFSQFLSSEYTTLFMMYQINAPTITLAKPKTVWRPPRVVDIPATSLKSLVYAHSGFLIFLQNFVLYKNFQTYSACSGYWILSEYG